VRAGLRNRMQDSQEGLSPLYTTPYGGSIIVKGDAMDCGMLAKFF
jgi:hypothetical protein